MIREPYQGVAQLHGAPVYARHAVPNNNPSIGEVRHHVIVAWRVRCHDAVRDPR